MLVFVKMAGGGGKDSFFGGKSCVKVISVEVGVGNFRFERCINFLIVQLLGIYALHPRVCHDLSKVTFRPESCCRVLVKQARDEVFQFI